jgi:hypothetical protein
MRNLVSLFLARSLAGLVSAQTGFGRSDPLKRVRPLQHQDAFAPAAADDIWFRSRESLHPPVLTLTREP